MSVTIDDCRRKEAETLVTSRFKMFLQKDGYPKKRAKTECYDSSPGLEESETLGSLSDDSSDDTNKTFNYSGTFHDI